MREREREREKWYAMHGWSMNGYMETNRHYLLYSIHISGFEDPRERKIQPHSAKCKIIHTPNI